jgi:hypothetical protein
MKKILIFSLMTLAFTACKKKVDEPKTDNPTIETFNLTVKILPTYNTQALNWSDQYITTAGDSIQFDKIKFLFSNFILEKTDGSLITLENQYAYLNLKEGRDSVVLKDVPKGSYKSIRYYMGLDSAINHSDPANWPLDHSLSPSLSDMHWGWAGGYIFNVIEGYYQNSGVKSGFTFHIALERNARVYAFAENFDVNADTRMVFNCRAERYFSNTIDFSLKNDGAFSHSGNVDPIMDKFIKNLNGLFEFKSVN